MKCWKKVSFIALWMCLGSIVVGCSRTNETVEQLIQAEMEDELQEENENDTIAYEESDSVEGEQEQDHWQAEGQEYESVLDSEGIIDLTVHNSLMIGVELTQIMRYPEQYIGRTIRMPGMYATSEDPNTGITYYYVLTWDATLCCQIGMEFILDDEAYPDLGEDIVVEGTFHTYEEFGITYCTLLDAQLI